MWTIYVRDPALSRVGQLDDFQKLDVILRFNDVGTWSLTMDGRAPLANLVGTAGYGIDVVRDDTTVVMSGPVRHRSYTRDGDELTLTVSGVDDNVWLKRRLAHPQPATAIPPYSSQEYDVRTGVASTVLRAYVDVNAGAGALAPRRVTGLTVDTDPVIGSTVTGRARWQELLALLQELAIAGGNLGFRVRKSGTSLLFQVYQPTDHTDTVVLSTEMGNVYGYTYESEVSSANYLYVGGGGEGTARTIQEGSDSGDVIEWGRIEAFTDQRDTTSTTELSQEITKALAESAGKTGLTVNPVDIDGTQFLVDYTLGDRVTYVVDGVSSTEVIREVQVSLTPDGPQQTVPTLSSPGRSDVLRLFSRLRSAEARIQDLERR